MSLLENFFKVLSLYFEARTRIRNRITEKVGSGSGSKWEAGSASASKWQAGSGSGSASRWCVSATQRTVVHCQCRVTFNINFRKSAAGCEAGWEAGHRRTHSSPDGLWGPQEGLKSHYTVYSCLLLKSNVDEMWTIFNDTDQQFGVIIWHQIKIELLNEN